MAKFIIYMQNTMASVIVARKILQANHDNIIAVVLATQIKSDSILNAIKTIYNLKKKYATRFFMYKLVESKIYSLLLSFHKLIGTKRYRTGEAVKISELTKKYGIHFIKAKDINSPEFLEIIKGFNPDFILCHVAQIIKKGSFDALGKKFINVHGSFLPEYRGAAQYIWYLLNDDDKYGVTIHYIEPGVDTGDIILQKKFDFGRPASAYRLHHSMAKSFGYMLNEFIGMAEAGKIKHFKQDEKRVTYAGIPNRSDMKRFKSKGLRLVNLKDFFDCI